MSSSSSRTFGVETHEAHTDPAYAWVRARLRGERLSVQLKKEQSALARLIWGFISFARQYGPTGTVYLNTGQITLAAPPLLAWLGSRADVSPIFMLHDAIPIEYPEYCSPRSSRSHRQMLASTARYAKGLIVTTQAAGESIRRELAGLHCNDIPMIAAPLPVALPFLEPAAPDRAVGASCFAGERRRTCRAQSGPSGLFWSSRGH
jgi:hypothetical protein